MKDSNKNTLLLFAILFAVGLLSFLSYKLGYKMRDTEYQDFSMMLWLDGNQVRTGVYNFLPNNQHKILQYNFENEGADVPEIKIVGEIKFFQVGDTIYDINDENVWKYLTNEQLFENDGKKFQKKKNKSPKKKKSKPSYFVMRENSTVEKSL